MGLNPIKTAYETTYPGNERWGEAAWTVLDKQDAKERYFALSKHLKEKGEQ